MATLSIDKDNKIRYDKENLIETRIAKEYKKLKRSTIELMPNWKYVSGRAGFVGSGHSNYLVILDGITYKVHADRYANGKSFWGTDHAFTIYLDSDPKL